jgi:hypothetical protein
MLNLFIAILLRVNVPGGVFQGDTNLYNLTSIGMVFDLIHLRHPPGKNRLLKDQPVY